MRKLLQNRNFQLFLVYLYIHCLAVVILFGEEFRITEVANVVVVSVLGLISLLLTVSMPLYASSEAERERKNEELKQTSLAVAEYVGIEILDNIAEIDKFLLITKNTLEEMPKPLEELMQKLEVGGVWATVSTELEVSLSDKWHQNLVKSGLVTNIPDKKVASNIRTTYQEQEAFIKRLRALPKLYFMIQNPPPNSSIEFIKYMINNKLMRGINEIKVDIEIYLKQAKATTDLINKMIEPYGGHIEIQDYSEKIL